jgi:N-acetylglutamate synthase
MNPADIEIASRLSWPALEERELPEGLLRCAAGVSRRSNSLIPAVQAGSRPGRTLQLAQDFFAPRKQPVIVRVPDFSSFCDFDQYLAVENFRKEAATNVMCRYLNSASAELGVSSQLEIDYSAWLAGWYEVKQMDRQQLPIHEQILAKIVHDSHYLIAVGEAGNVLATGMGVLTNNSLGILGIATSARYRKRGLAQGVMNSLLAWGMEKGARYAYLQVEADNAAACQLYRKLGFETQYSYWYRVQQNCEAVQLPQEQAL